MTDDEKFLWKNLTIEEVKKMALNNIKDIISVGFDPAKTFIFTNTEYMWLVYFYFFLYFFNCLKLIALKI